MADATPSPGASGRARLRLLALATAPLVVAALLFQELFESLAATGFGDYQFFHHSWELGRVALSRHGELPLWNPYQCGGIPEWGDPQSQLFHPLFYVSFLLGTTLSLKLFILLHAAAGLAGMYRYARSEEQLGRPAASLAALAWAGSGFFAWHVGSGHGGFVAFYLTPWLLLGFRRSLTDLRWAAFVALIFVATLLAGGVYAYPYFALLLGFDALAQLIARVDWKKLAAALGTAALLTLLLSALRLVPIVEHLIWYPRFVHHRDAVSLRELWNFLTHFDRAEDLVTLPGHMYVRVEYGAYVGVGVVALALLGAVVSARTRGRLVGSLVVFTSFSLGDFASFAPWSLLHRLPVFSSLQVPSRFLYAVTFFLALLAAVGLEWLWQRASEASLARAWLERLGSRSRLVPWLAVAALGVPIVAQHRSVLDGRWRSKPVVADSPAHYFIQATTTWDDEGPPRAQAPARHVSDGRCYTGMTYKGATGLWTGDEAQARVIPSGGVLREGRTTRTAFADVDVPFGGRLIFNQTFAPGWRAWPGVVTVDDQRLAVDLPPGRYHVFARYAPSSLLWAALGSLVGLGGVAVLLVVRKPRWRGLALAAGCAWAVATYASAVRPGPRLPPEPTKLVLSVGASDFAERGINTWYRPENAIDGRIETEWLTPPGRKAWLDVRLDAPRAIHHVVLVNAKNPPHGDYASREVRIESFREGRQVSSASARFGDTTSPQTGVTLSGTLVDQVRISVESWQGAGGGLAEVRLF